jgi:eukaryotic-like serine/threonine-protein kinase
LRLQTPDMPPALEAVVLKALEKDPHRRFASIQEFAAALEQACQDVLPATKRLFPNYTPALSSAIPTMPVQLAFHASPTLADVRLQPPKREKHGIPRRVLLSGAIGIAGLSAIGGGLVWWTRTQKPPLGSTLVMYTGHLNTVTTVAWSPDSARIASGSWDQTVQVWDATTGTHPLIYRGHTTNVNAVAWSPLHTGHRIASASGNNFFKGDFVVLVWNAATGRPFLTYSGHTQPVHTAAWSPNGARIASGGEDKTVQVWDASNGSPLLAYSRHTDMISAVAWSPDGRRIASASNDTTVQVWDASTGTPIFTCNHTSTVNAVAWSPDGRRIASASGNFFFGSGFGVQVWDAATGVHILTYRGHRAPVSTLAWSSDSKRIASASASLEKTVQVWDARSGATIFTYRGHTLGVNTVAWSPHGALIASGSLDGTVRVWLAP